MIREIIKAEDTKLTIEIPQEYVGREIEYIIFPIKDHQRKENKEITSLGGILHQYADTDKQKLEDKGWELQVVDKFSK